MTTPRKPFFYKGDKVKRLDTGDEAEVTQDEENGYLYVQYDGVSRPMLQIASNFRKITP